MRVVWGAMAAMMLTVSACEVAPGDVADDTDLGVDDAAGPPTWARDVGPLLTQRCGSCHQEGGIAPMALTTYADAFAWREAIEQVVADGTMPPFDAVTSADCTPPAPWKDDPRLTDEEHALLADWIAAGAPEGTAASDLPLQVPAPDVLLAPKATVSIPAPYTVDGDHDTYVCFRVEVPHDSDVWITGVQVVPDNTKVVHHVLVWNDPLDLSAAKAGDDGSYPCSGTPDFYPTDLIGTWTPGASVLRAPEGTGTLFKAGATVVVNVHYHPTGGAAEVDQSSVALEWTDVRPSKYLTWFLMDIPFGGTLEDGPNDELGRRFYIPPDVPDHQETVTIDTGTYLPFPIQIYAVTPHMHYLGRDMLVTIEHDDAPDTCLVHTPTYRFDWQTTYVYDAPLSELPTIAPGDKVRVRCTYDNSWSNPNLPAALAASHRDEPGPVTWGEETSDEMCMAMVGLVMPPIDLSSLFGLF